MGIRPEFMGFNKCDRIWYQVPWEYTRNSWDSINVTQGSIKKGVRAGRDPHTTTPGSRFFPVYFRNLFSGTYWWLGVWAVRFFNPPTGREGAVASPLPRRVQPVTPSPTLGAKVSAICRTVMGLPSALRAVGCSPPLARASASIFASPHATALPTLRQATFSAR